MVLKWQRQFKSNLRGYLLGKILDKGYLDTYCPIQGFEETIKRKKLFMTNHRSCYINVFFH